MTGSVTTQTDQRFLETQSPTQRTTPGNASKSEELDNQSTLTPDNASSVLSGVQGAKAPNCPGVCSESIHSRSLSSLTSVNTRDSQYERPSPPFSWVNFIAVQYREKLPAAKKYFWFFNAIKVLTILASTVALATGDEFTCDRPYLPLIVLHYALLLVAFPCDLVMNMMNCSDNAREAAQLAGLSVPPKRIHWCMGKLQKLFWAIEVVLVIVDNYMLFTQITCKQTSPSLYAAMWVWVIRGYIGIGIPLFLYGCCWSCLYAINRTIDDSALLIPMDPTKLSSLRLLRYCKEPTGAENSGKGVGEAKLSTASSMVINKSKPDDGNAAYKLTGTIASSVSKQQKITYAGVSGEALNTASLVTTAQCSQPCSFRALPNPPLTTCLPNAAGISVVSLPTSADGPSHGLAESINSKGRAEICSMHSQALRSTVSLNQHHAFQRTSRSTLKATGRPRLDDQSTRDGGTTGVRTLASLTRSKRSTGSRALFTEYISVPVHQVGSVDLAASQVASVTTADSDSEEDDDEPLVLQHEARRSQTSSTCSYQDLPQAETLNDGQQRLRRQSFLLKVIQWLTTMIGKLFKWFESKAPPEPPELEKIYFANVEDARCFICFTDYEDGDTLREFPCDHYFHQTCADRWLGIGKCCPLCKSDIAKALKRKSSKNRAPAPIEPISSALLNFSIRIANTSAAFDQSRFRRIIKALYDLYAQLPLLFGRMAMAPDDHPSLGAYFTCCDDEDQFIFTSRGVVYQVKYVDCDSPETPYFSLVPVKGDVTERTTSHYYNYMLYMLRGRNGHGHASAATLPLERSQPVYGGESDPQSHTCPAVSTSTVSLPIGPEYK